MREPTASEQNPPTPYHSDVIRRDHEALTKREAQTTRDLEQGMEKHLGPGSPGDDPWAETFNPEGDASALCRHCWFPVALRQVRTGMSRNPWRKAWVHADSGDLRCSSPMAIPDITPAGGDA